MCFYHLLHLIIQPCITSVQGAGMGNRYRSLWVSKRAQKTHTMSRQQNVGNIIAAARSEQLAWTV